MIVRDDHPEGDNAASQRLTFGRYVLDLRRGSLLLDGREIALRPKTFARAAVISSNIPGRLVSKEELLEAVWPNLVVTDDTLVQSIGELRRALGESGARLIATVPRRGYRFEVDGGAARPAQGARLASRCASAGSTESSRRSRVALTVLALWLVPKFRDAHGSAPRWRPRSPPSRCCRSRTRATMPRANISPTASRRTSSTRWADSRRSP